MLDISKSVKKKSVPNMNSTWHLPRHKVQITTDSHNGNQFTVSENFH